MLLGQIDDLTEAERSFTFLELAKVLGHLPFDDPLRVFEIPDHFLELFSGHSDHLIRWTLLRFAKCVPHAEETRTREGRELVLATAAFKRTYCLPEERLKVRCPGVRRTHGDLLGMSERAGDLRRV